MRNQLAISFRRTSPASRRFARLIGPWSRRLGPGVLAAASAVALQARAPLASGHADVGIGYEAGAWNLHVHQESTDTEWAPGSVILQAPAVARTRVTDDARFGFLGEPGDAVWMLPETELSGLLFLGLGAEEIEAGTFVEDRVTLTLKRVHGPGHFFLFHTDAFGNPVIAFNSKDGIDDGDVRELIAGSHSHVNWAFDTTGTYRIAVRASGILQATGQRTSSEIGEYLFRVHPVALSREHIDIRILPGSVPEAPLKLRIRDANVDLTYDAHEVFIQATEEAILTLPGGTPFGDEGEPIWVLPQSQNPSLPYIGFNAEGIAAEAYEGPLRFELRSVTGPGDFFLWQANAAGLDVQMNTEDGIDASDRVELPAGGHAHHNWGFTQPGSYCVTLRPTGNPNGEATIAAGPETTITFRIEPLPEEPAFEVWRRGHWPTCAPETIAGTNADPDEDGLINALEYAFGLDPLIPSREGLPRMEWVMEDGTIHGALRFTRVKGASDLQYLPVVATDLVAGSWEEMTDELEVLDQGATERVLVRDPEPATQAGHRFYQLRVRPRSSAISTSRVEGRSP